MSRWFDRMLINPSMKWDSMKSRIQTLQAIRTFWHSTHSSNSSTRRKSKPSYCLEELMENSSRTFKKYACLKKNWMPRISYFVLSPWWQYIRCGKKKYLLLLWCASSFVSFDFRWRKTHQKWILAYGWTHCINLSALNRSNFLYNSCMAWC